MRTASSLDFASRPFTNLGCFLILAWAWTATSCQEPVDDHSDDLPQSIAEASEIYAGVPATEGSFDDVFDPTIINFSELIAAMNLASYHAEGFRGQNITIAILDNGFSNLNDSKGIRLPPYIEVEPAPGNPEQDTIHGTKLAELVYGLATGSTYYEKGEAGPKLLLYNTNGFTNLQHAINDVIKRRVNMVVYSQVWEYGGNQDGRGFINAEVNRATSNGILWLNAAGNFAESSFTGPVNVNSLGDVNLPDSGDTLKFTVDHPDTEVKITLAWNDFTDSISYRSAQDLDLYLYDANHRQIAASTLIQSGRHGSDIEGHTHHAREIIRVVLTAGDYRLKVKAKTRNFTTKSRLSLAVSGFETRLLNNHNAQSVFIPADNPSVLTVGASDASFSSYVASKPELLTPSIVSFNDGSAVHGSSTAAAVAAATLAVYQSRFGLQARHEIIAKLRSGELVSQDHETMLNIAACRRWDHQGLPCPYAPTGQRAPVLRLP